ncbi:Protein CBG27054 [Caenorhabditis briggsae]|uniref:Protein CBG27053 n=1 Tax=Caenorhabditis briggsae TaxID=6238 RepID=G2J754_CAEBR|nr:Protein CBG27053 [Caenorhabditis briggsae]XP_045100605.1 Protein CBG27054 [Caenorhabditis briggsae]CAS01047.1 Protein CBG27053 [Caenorhabditis briggsae]CAS01048.1 Protein CBG27054 [Caenorhabditis briggsae]
MASMIQPATSETSSVVKIFSLENRKLNKFLQSSKHEALTDLILPSVS